MVRLTNEGVFYINGKMVRAENADDKNISKGKEGTISYGILNSHNVGNEEDLKIKFDGMASHDITYVGIIQTARAGGLEKFPIPYVLTNCHNSLCAVGGTINEDDHIFGLSAAKKYGGIFVPAHQAVIHSYMREEMTGCGKMLLGSDSHTRYGALGTMACGEGGPELVKQLLNRTYDIKRPEVIAIYMTGKTVPGVGPQDVAIAVIKEVFKNGFVKNKIMEFIGPGIAAMSADFRNGIDVMTTETTCLSSIWETDGEIRKYYEIHGRPEDYKELKPKEGAYYSGAVEVDLSKIRPMIALPFHPSNGYTIEEFNENTLDILRQVEIEGTKAIDTKGIELKLTDKVVNGRLKVDQGVIAGCAGGTFENIMMANAIMKHSSVGSDEFWLSVYPGSQPINLELTKNGTAASLMSAGATWRTAFCGPCFGAGDVPANQSLSIRHTTRNFPNREGSKPDNGQISSVALMDARSIAATAAKGGILTPATECDIPETDFSYGYDRTPYNNRVYRGYGKAQPELELKFGPNIADWPQMSQLTDHMLLEMVSVIHDEVTTTDELIPSGETSSFRSNPMRLAEFTLSRKDPGYVARAKANREYETARKGSGSDELNGLYRRISDVTGQKGLSADNTGVGSVIFARKPGDGSAREQAASCQRVLGGWANIALEYATKRYRSNLINWGMLPFIIDESESRDFRVGDRILVVGIKKALLGGENKLKGYRVSDTDQVREISLTLPGLSDGERDILVEGCLINYYSRENE